MTDQQLAKTLSDVIATLKTLSTPRPLSSWHDDDGAVLWWRIPVDEPPYCGTPGDSDWPGYQTHWTPLPAPPNQ